MNKILSRCAMFTIIVTFHISINNAAAQIIDLNTFEAFPASNVDISIDGSSATFYEDIFYSPVSLENLSFQMPTDAKTLKFDYELTVALDNEDYFDFYLGDTSAPLFSVGGFADSIIYDAPLVWNDTFEFDISAYSGSSTAMVFGFIYGWEDWGTDSILTISNLEIVERILVPEPSTFILLVLGIMGIMSMRRTT